MLANKEQMHSDSENSQVDINSKTVETWPDNSDQYDDDKPLCRLCYGTKYDDSNLIEPCLCKGTVAKVHRKCLENWLNRIGSKRCDLCLFEFKCKETLRYGLWQSIRIWTRQYRRRRYLMADFCLFLTMNFITLAMIALLLQAVHHAYTDETLKDVLPTWYYFILGIATTLWVIVYFMTFVVFFNTQIKPWFMWWRSTKTIQITD